MPEWQKVADDIDRVSSDDDSDNAWIKVGNDMDGEHSYDDSGQSVSLSADSRSVAIGVPYNDGSGSSSDHVWV